MVHDDLAAFEVGQFTDDDGEIFFSGYADFTGHEELGCWSKMEANFGHNTYLKRLDDSSLRHIYPHGYDANIPKFDW